MVYVKIFGQPAMYDFARKYKCNCKLKNILVWKVFYLQVEQSLQVNAPFLVFVYFESERTISGVCIIISSEKWRNLVFNAGLKTDTSNCCL